MLSVAILLFTHTLAAEVVPISLKQALDRALRANPDVLLARVEGEAPVLRERVALP